MCSLQRKGECVVCDLDGTLINGNSFREALLLTAVKALKRLQLIAVVKIVSHVVMRKFRFCSHSKMKYALLPVMQQVLSMNDIDELTEHLMKMINKSVLTEVYKFDFDLRILATAAPEIYARKFGEKVGFKTVIATEMPTVSKLWLENSCQNKADAVVNYMSKIPETYVSLIISDHKDDIPLTKQFPKAEVIWIKEY